MRAIWKLFCILLAGSAHAEESGASFRDDFEVFNRGTWMISDGWSNGDWMNCTWSREAVSIDEGKLGLRLFQSSKGTGTNRCGEIQSHAKYGFGTYEALLRTGAGSGINAAFFTYIGPAHDRPHHEIDVEILLRDTAQVSFNTYVDGVPLNGKSVALPNPSDREFVHVAFEWRPESVVWLINGNEVHRTEEGTKLPTEPQKIYASLWSSSTFTDWMGPFDAKAMPQRMAIEWLAYTRLGEPCQFEASVLCNGK
jgi:endo-1,3-1,4-beta-glycanase ExoK